MLKVYYFTSNMVTLILITLFIILLVITTISCIFFSTIHSPWWTRSRKFLDKWQLTRHVARDTCDSISGENVLGSTSCDPFLPTRDLTCPTQVLLGPLDNDLAHFKSKDTSVILMTTKQLLATAASDLWKSYYVKVYQYLLRSGGQPRHNIKKTARTSSSSSVQHSSHWVIHHCTSGYSGSYLVMFI